MQRQASAKTNHTLWNTTAGDDENDQGIIGSGGPARPVPERHNVQCSKSNEWNGFRSRIQNVKLRRAKELKVEGLVASFGGLEMMANFRATSASFFFNFFSSHVLVTCTPSQQGNNRVYTRYTKIRCWRTPRINIFCSAQ